MRTGIWRYLRQHHLAFLALFVALGGTSYAALANTGEQHRDQAV
jgi:hypothetical protein